MQLKNKPTQIALQAQIGVSDSGSGSFSPSTKVRVILTPPVRQRITRRYYDLRHSIRRIAKTEGMPEAVIEQMTRERYWDAVNASQPPAGPAAVSPMRFGGGLMSYGRAA